MTSGKEENEHFQGIFEGVEKNRKIKPEINRAQTLIIIHEIFLKIVDFISNFKKNRNSVTYSAIFTILNKKIVSMS